MPKELIIVVDNRRATNKERALGDGRESVSAPGRQSRFVIRPKINPTDASLQTEGNNA